MIEYLINNAEKFNIGIIDDREHHDRIEFHFEKVAILMNNDCHFYGVKTLIYFTKLDEINVTLEDEYMIGCINDISAINKIINLTNFKTIYKKDDRVNIYFDHYGKEEGDFAQITATDSEYDEKYEVVNIESIDEEEFKKLFEYLDIDEHISIFYNDKEVGTIRGYSNEQ